MRENINLLVHKAVTEREKAVNKFVSDTSGISLPLSKLQLMKHRFLKLIGRGFKIERYNQIAYNPPYLDVLVVKIKKGNKLVGKASFPIELHN